MSAGNFKKLSTKSKKVQQPSTENDNKHINYHPTTQQVDNCDNSEATNLITHITNNMRYINNLGGNYRENFNLYSVGNFHNIGFMNFLQPDPKTRTNTGLEELLQSLFPIHHPRSKIIIEYIKYEVVMDDSISPEICKHQGTNYECTIRVLLRIRYDDNIMEFWNTLGQIPYLTEEGYCIINGKERLFVHQIQRAPGISFFKKKQNTYNIKIYPKSGTWISINIEHNQMNIAMNKMKAFPITSFLWVLFISSKVLEDYKDYDKCNEEILEGYLKKYDHIGCFMEDFHHVKTAVKTNDLWTVKIDASLLVNTPVNHNIHVNGQVVCSIGNILQSNIKESVGEVEILQGLYVAENVYDDNNKLILAVGQRIKEQHLEYLQNKNSIKYFQIDDQHSNILLNSFNYSNVTTVQEALTNWANHNKIGIYKGFANVLEKFINSFCLTKSFDFHEIGCYHIGTKLKRLKHIDRSLTYTLFKEIIFTSFDLQNDKYRPDDIDSLANKHICSTGEILLTSMKRGVNKFLQGTKSKLSSLQSVIDNNKNNIDQIRKKFSDICNLRYLSTQIYSNHSSSPDSYLVTHVSEWSKFCQKYKVTSVQQAGMKNRTPIDAREYNTSAIGRICSTQTPEGQKTGLSGFLATGVKIDQYGFLLVPYHPVVNGEVSSDVVYLNASEDMDKILSFPSLYNIKQNQLVAGDKYIKCIKNGSVGYYHYKQVDYVFVNEVQLFGVSTASIPLINQIAPYRALVASNMCGGQTVPLCRTETPSVITGVEKIYRSGVICKTDGVVERVDAKRIVVRTVENKIEFYKLADFYRTNHNTIVEQTPIVRLGQNVTKGQILAENNDYHKGLLSLGTTLKVAYMSHIGTFEDGQILSSSVYCNNKLSHFYITTIECNVEDNRKGLERTTSDIPDVPKAAVAHLDESGIVKLHTQVKPGQILVGKVAPSVYNNSKERAFLNLLTNNKNNVVDVSLRVPSGIQGIVTKVDILTAKGYQKDDRALLQDTIEYRKLQSDINSNISILWESFQKNALAIISNKKLVEVITKSKNIDELLRNKLANDNKQLMDMCVNFQNSISEHYDQLEKYRARMSTGCTLPDNVFKIIRVYIAQKYKINSGDKCTNRQGHKGTINSIKPVHEMPYDAKTGEPVDMIIGPLGLVSRSNINQLIEATLGECIHRAQYNLKYLLNKLYLINDVKKPQDIRINIKFAPNSQSDPSFTNKSKMLQYLYQEIKNNLEYLTGSNAPENTEDLLRVAQYFAKEGCSWLLSHFKTISREKWVELLKFVGLDQDDKTEMVDGATGQKFLATVMSGRQYILKLVHSVVSKFNARSDGGYTSLSCQPPGGKSRFGGQKLGEMEAWAIAAYGAPLILHEMFCYKSDNIKGRSIFRKHLERDDIFSILFDNRNKIGTGGSFELLKNTLLAANVLLSVEDNPDYNINNKKSNKNFTTKQTREKYSMLRLLSDEEVLSMSSGEVTSAATVHYDKGKPEEGGFCCPKIFGISKEFSCLCGQVFGSNYNGVTCENCGVTALSRARRSKRMGHINLNIKIVHPWFVNGNNNYLAILLGMSSKTVMQIVHLELFYVFDGGSSKMNPGDTISESLYDDIFMQYPDIDALTGGEAIYKLLSQINLQELITKHYAIAQNTTKNTVKQQCNLICQVALSILNSGVDLKNVVFSVLPIVPINRREIYHLSGKRFGTGDINIFYKHIFSRVSRLQSFTKQIGSSNLPFVRLMMRAIQKSIDEFFVGSAGDYNNNLESLINQLSSKDGIFRKYNLGRRIDYSGRTVIVAAHLNIKIDEAVIPIDMMLTFLKYKMIKWLQDAGLASDFSSAMLLINQKHPAVLSLLRQKTTGSYVILNRQPTLHRNGMLAFKAILSSGNINAIGLHPLVCSVFNADFDGDQMAVYFSLSVEANLEAVEYLLPSKNLLSVATINNTKKRVVMNINKDMLLGIYYLTYQNTTDLISENGKNSENEMKKFYEYRNVYYQLNQNKINLQESIKYYDTDTKSWHVTTAGRLMFWSIVPDKHLFKFANFNKIITSEDTGYIVEQVLINNQHRQNAAAKFLDDAKYLGFQYGYWFSGSFSMTDLIKMQLFTKDVQNSQQKELAIVQQIEDELITEDHARSQIIDLWQENIHNITTKMEQYAKNNPINPLIAIVQSGARGSMTQILRLVALIGVVSGLTGDLSVIANNYANGIDPLDYLRLTYSARHECGVVQSKTADSGYGLRKEIEAVNGLVINLDDCKTTKICWLTNLFIDNQLCLDVYERVMGRTLALDIEINGQIIHKNTLINHYLVNIFKQAKLYRIPVRAPYNCDAPNGSVCRACYGMDYSTGNFVDIGTACGIVAAQSITEPATQLSLGSYHKGGVQQIIQRENIISAHYDGKICFHKIRTIYKDNKHINIAHNSQITIINDNREILAEYNIHYGAELLVEDGQTIISGQPLVNFSYSNNIICEHSGTVRFSNMIAGTNYKFIKQYEQHQVINKRLILNYTKLPVLIITDQNGEEHYYNLPGGYLVSIQENTQVQAGDIIGQIYLAGQQTLDMVDSLDFVLSVLECHDDKNAACLSPGDGIINVSNHNTKVDHSEVRIQYENQENSILLGVFPRHTVMVQNQEHVQKGDQITQGMLNLQNVLKYRGIDACANLFVSLIMREYQANSIAIDEKHLLVILRTLSNYHKITNVEYDQDNLKYKDILVVNDQVITREEKKLLEQHIQHNKLNMKLTTRRILFGLQKTACNSPAILSNISFQFFKASIARSMLKGAGALQNKGHKDFLHSIKSALISDQKIYAGTALIQHHVDCLLKNVSNIKTFLSVYNTAA